MATVTPPRIAPRLFSPALQQAVRNKFWHAAADPFSGARAYLENAGGGLTLKTALEADQRISGLPDNAGRDNPASREVDRALKQGRRDVALLMNAGQGTILADQSTTACAFRILEAAAAGLAGGNIVCSQLDHASFYDAAGIIAKRHQQERRIVPLDRATGALDPSAVLGAIDERTVAVTLIHASNITGGKNDLKALAAAIRARAPQAIIVADGAQHAQHGLIDVEGWGVDAYVFSAYKVFSKAGFAFAYLSPRLAARPHAQLAGKASSDWDLGTRDAGGFAAFSCVIDYLCWLGAETGSLQPSSERRALLADAVHAIECHEAALSERLLRGTAERPGLLGLNRVTVHGKQHPYEGREAVFAFSVAGLPTGRLVKEFGARGVIVHDRVSDAYSRHTLEGLGVSEVVRVSLAHYNSLEEVNAFLDALGTILNTHP